MLGISVGILIIRKLLLSEFHGYLLMPSVLSLHHSTHCQQECPLNQIFAGFITTNQNPEYAEEACRISACKKNIDRNLQLEKL